MISRSDASRPERLGPLERQLLRLVWERGDATVRELFESREVRGAYTTVMTTLDRLYKKGLLSRVTEGRAFRYSPRQTSDEYKVATIRRVMDEMLFDSVHSATLMSCLVEAVSGQDCALLDELERAIEEKRRELREKEGQ